MPEERTASATNGSALPALPERLPTAGFYSGEYTIRASDVDPTGRFRLDGIARFLQDIAADDLAASGFGSVDPVWIVRRTIVDVLQPISWPAKVRLERWCSAVSSHWSNMRVRLQADHETNPLNPVQRGAGLVETESFWINVDQNGFPARISDEGFAWLASMTDMHRLHWRPAHPRHPPQKTAAGLATDRRHVLRFSDFDPLNHMNNAAYWAILEDELTFHRDITTGQYRAIIEYLRPIPLDAVLTVRRQRVEDQLRIWLIVNDQVVSTITATAILHGTLLAPGETQDAVELTS